METATLAGGCFWCTEALFKNLRGVKSVIPGYSEGAESVRIEFDSKIISYRDILYIFFKTHDPTTMNRQGADIGTQYRSVVFYMSEKQRGIAERMKKDLQNDYKDPIVTEIRPFKKFYKAEDYHKNYYENHRNSPYCMLVIDPKLKKLRKDFGRYL